MIQRKDLGRKLFLPPPSLNSRCSTKSTPVAVPAVPAAAADQPGGRARDGRGVGEGAGAAGARHHRHRPRQGGAAHPELETNLHEV